MSRFSPDTLASIRNAVAMTTNPRLPQLLALLIEHEGLGVDAAAPLLGLPWFMTLRFANRLVALGYATCCTQGKDERYVATISGRAIDAVMRPGSLR
jgi:hypothetical protein